MGYYMTPNLYVPYNRRERGEIADVAKEQLAAWESLAKDWPRYPDGRAIRCGECCQSMYFSRDINGVIYSYTDEEKLALMVAHIRQRHSEWYSNERG